MEYKVNIINHNTTEIPKASVQHRITRQEQECNATSCNKRSSYASNGYQMGIKLASNGQIWANMDVT